MKKILSLTTAFAIAVTVVPSVVTSAESSGSSRWEKFLKYDLCITNYDELSDDEKELCNFIYDSEQAAGDNIVCERARRTLAGDDVGERITLDQLEDAYGLWDSFSFYNTFSGWQTYIDCVPDVICLNYVSEKNSYVFYYNKEYWLDDERSSYVLFREKVTPDSQSHFEVYDGNDRLIKTFTTKFDSPTKDFRGDTEYMKEFGMIHKNGGWYYTKPDGTAVFAWCDHSLPSSSKKITEPFVIESEINGCPVTAIEKNAFACAPLTEIVLPDTIKVIDCRAFIDCKYLEKISFPQGLRYIGKLAFYGCDSLTDITLDCPDLTLGEDVFFESLGLKTADINVKEIGENAFALCKNLESVTLGSSVENIRYRAFYGDILLTEVDLPDSVRNIGQEALDSLTSVTIPYFVEVIGSYPHKTMQEFTLGLTPPSPLRPLKDKPQCAFGENCVIYGHAGTEAESYADEWGLEFVSLDSTSKYTAPTITFEKGDASVKLSWTAVDGAEKYGVVGWINNRWQLIDQCEDTSYVLNNLKAGNNYKVAVVTMIGNEWHKDFSNAITVTPLTSAVSKYPNVTNIKYSDKYPQFKLEWNAVDGATQYGIAVKLAGKWKVWAYTDETDFISPKLKAGSTAEMVICAKVNGEWDTSNINSRAFVVTIDNATTTETLPVVFEITPSKTGVDEFLVNNPTIKSSYKDDELFNITPQEITEKFGFKIFKYSQNCETYLEYQGEVYQLGTGWGGPGTVSFAVADLNGDKHYELYFIYSWGSGLNHVVIDCFDTSSSFKFEGFDQYWSDDVVFAVENGKLGVYKAKYTSDIKAVPTEKIGEITADNEKNKVVFVPVNSSGTDSNKSAIAGKIFAYEKEGVGGYCTLSFNENGRFLFSPGKLSNYMGGGDWKIDGDTVSLIGMVNKTIYLKITDDTLVYIAEGSDEFPYMDIKDGEKFSIYRPEISSDKFQLNSRYLEYGLGNPKVELNLMASELPEFCYVENVRLYDEDDNFIGMMSPAMDADLWSYLVDCHVTEECSKTYYTLTNILCGAKPYLDDVRSEITVNFK